MKANFTNKANVRGYVFSYDLQKRTSRAGQEYIGGRMSVATDDAGMNVVQVDFPYVAPTFKNGNLNSTYSTLEQFIAGNVRTFESDGANATRVRIDGEVDVNDWVNRDGEAVCTKRVRGRYLHELAAGEQLDGHATFDADALIQVAATRQSSDGSDYMELRGFFFSFGKDVLPVTLSVSSEQGMKFFEDRSITPSTPYFGAISGVIQNTTIVTKQEEDASDIGFGEPTVRTTTRTFRTWEVKTAHMPQELDETTITADELKAAMANRENALAEVRKRWSERQGASANNAGFPAATAPATKPAAASASIANFKF